MDKIKDVVTEVIQGLKNRQPLKDASAELLKQILPKKELRHVSFRYCRRGTLGITVDSSVWLYQLNLQKPALLAKLARKSKGIKDIRFYIGETP